MRYPLPRAAAFAAALALAAASAAPSAAAQVTRPLDATGTSSFSISVGGDTYLQVFQLGNFVQQTFNGVGLPTVSALALDMQYYTSLVSATPFSFDVLLNGTNVGSIAFLAANNPGPGSFAANNPGPGSFIRAAAMRSLAFAPVAAIGGGYTVRLQQTNATVPAGQGSIGFDNNAAGGAETTVTFNPTAVPEPTTLALLAAGVVAAGARSAVSARRARRAAA